MRREAMIAAESGSLTQLCTRDLLSAFRLSPFWAPLARVPASRFALLLRRFDQEAGQRGLPSAGRLILDSMRTSLSVEGANHIPANGPVILASNHPGLTDAMAIWASAGRADLKILAAERDLLSCLPQISKSLILIRPSCLAPLKEALRHLREGGALLTFPAGKIEPDPSVRPGAVQSLAGWSTSSSLLASRAKGTKVIPCCVSGVISPQALRSRLTRWLPTAKDRDWAAATLQIVAPHLRRTEAQVSYGEAADSHSDLLGKMESLLKKRPGCLS